MVGRQNYDQLCPLASALDIVGTRWALLIVRDLLLGPRRFSDLAASLESASTDMLTTRLRQLEQAEVLARTTDRRYELTDRGYQLAPVLDGLLGWALRHEVPLGASDGADFDGARRLMSHLAVAARTNRSAPGASPHELIGGDLHVLVWPDHARWGAYALEAGESVDEVLSARGIDAGPIGRAAFTMKGLLEYTIAGFSPDELVATGELEISGPTTKEVLTDWQVAGRST